MLGIDTTVIIGHGISNDTAIQNMILAAHQVANENLPEQIKAAFYA